MEQLHELYEQRVGAELDYLIGLEARVCIECAECAHVECQDCEWSFCHQCSADYHKSSGMRSHIQHAILLQSNESEYAPAQTAPITPVGLWSISGSSCRGIDVTCAFPEPFESNYPWRMHTVAKLEWAVSTEGETAFACWFMRLILLNDVQANSDRPGAIILRWRIRITPFCASIVCFCNWTMTKAMTITSFTAWLGVHTTPLCTPVQSETCS